nr:MAG TPA: hypothetical protein [Caudoviricetes sp.]
MLLLTFCTLNCIIYVNKNSCFYCYFTVILCIYLYFEKEGFYNGNKKNCYKIGSCQGC